MVSPSSKHLSKTQRTSLTERDCAPIPPVLMPSASFASSADTRGDDEPDTKRSQALDERMAGRRADAGAALDVISMHCDVVNHAWRFVNGILADTGTSLSNGASASGGARRTGSRLPSHRSANPFYLDAAEPSNAPATPVEI
jgi:hypothetical protein